MSYPNRLRWKFAPRLTCLLGVVLLLAPVGGWSHPIDMPITQQVNAWIAGFEADQQSKITLEFQDPERYRFRWIPGLRQGVRLDQLNDEQRHQLRDILRTVLSEAGANKVDAIIATEAALGVIENATDYRDPGKYWTTVFGAPGEDAWGIRFEGHHLSVNLTFEGNRLISATPLFLGANPETVPSGPDAGLRALEQEVDLGWAVYQSLDESQRGTARGAEEWFAGFLTSAGERRANLGKPAGIATDALNDSQQQALKRLIGTYVETITPAYTAGYLKNAFREEWPYLRFYWRGADEPGDAYYYRIAGKRLLIEHENRSGGTHIHAIWRDINHDFGGL